MDFATCPMLILKFSKVGADECRTGSAPHVGGGALRWPRISPLIKGVIHFAINYQPSALLLGYRNHVEGRAVHMSGRDLMLDLTVCRKTRSAPAMSGLLFEAWLIGLNQETGF
jgi:hypothetical protein